MTYRDKDMLHTLCESQKKINDFYGQATNGGKYDPTLPKYVNDLKLDPNEPHWERKVYPNGFIEEFWENQRC